MYNVNIPMVYETQLTYVNIRIIIKEDTKDADDTQRDDSISQEEWF